MKKLKLALIGIDNTSHAKDIVSVHSHRLPATIM